MPLCEETKELIYSVVKGIVAEIKAETPDMQPLKRIGQFGRIMEYACGDRQGAQVEGAAAKLIKLFDSPQDFDIMDGEVTYGDVRLAMLDCLGDVNDELFKEMSGYRGPVLWDECALEKEIKKIGTHDDIVHHMLPTFVAKQSVADGGGKGVSSDDELSDFGINFPSEEYDSPISRGAVVKPSPKLSPRLPRAAEAVYKPKETDGDVDGKQSLNRGNTADAGNDGNGRGGRWTVFVGSSEAGYCPQK